VSPSIVVLATTTAATVQSCYFPTAAASGSEATIVVHTYRFSVPPMREARPPCSRLQPSEARQLTVSSDNCGNSTKGLKEGPVGAHKTLISCTNMSSKCIK
jgi:hypothetical protein